MRRLHQWIIGVAGTPHGIELTFSKPMNPVLASNVHNYTVHVNGTTISGNDDFLQGSNPGNCRILVNSGYTPVG